MLGKIIINPFGIPGQNVHQAQRLKDEFEKLGVDIEIIPQAYLRLCIENNDIKNSLGNPDFVVYLDKDKYLSSMLEKVGVRLFNSHDAIRTCDDKGETYIALAGKGFNLPKTLFAPVCYRNECQVQQEYINNIEKEIGYPVVVKSSYGSCGSGVFLAKDRENLLNVLDNLKLTPHMCQEYLGKQRGKDVRVIVIGGKAVAAMIRSNDNDFRSNIALGGNGQKIDLNDKEFSQVIEHAEMSAKALALDYCGVDILFGESDEPVICEVNSNAFFEGIEGVTGENVAKKYAEYIIKQVNK